MIKKLRRKFILIATLSVFFILGILISVINVTNYIKINANTQRVIEILLTNNGSFPENSSQFPSRDNPYDWFSPETPFAVRYFSVVVDQSGQPVVVETSKIAAVTPKEAAELAAYLHHHGERKGRHDDYKFASKTIEDSGRLYVFVDASREITSFRMFLRASLIISAITIVLVGGIIILISSVVLKPIEESYEKQKAFITNANHDIKTPITIISTETQLIEMEHGESEWTKEIKNQVNRLTKLTDKLVFLSKMDEEIKLDMRQLCLSTVLGEALQPYDSIAKSKGFTFEKYIEDNVWVTANEEMLYQAVALLMDNALKYTAPNGNIFVGLQRTNKNIKLTFTNTAENLPTGNLDKIFERFYRLDESRNSRTGGNGIGMSVVKAIITAHKGKISAQSVDGKNIEITILL